MPLGNATLRSTQTGAKSGNRHTLVNTLAREYRQVLKGTGNERAFGAKLEQYSISPAEMTTITRLARQKVAELPY